MFLPDGVSVRQGGRESERVIEQTVMVSRCERCDQPLAFRDVVLGVCPRCGRYVPAG
jgi:Zn finger protein HypA/HybF involved in hydrogenase expression